MYFRKSVPKTDQESGTNNRKPNNREENQCGVEQGNFTLSIKLLTLKNCLGIEL